KIALNKVRLAVVAEGDPGLWDIVLHLLPNPYFIGGLFVIALGACLFFTLLYTTDISRALPVMGGIGYIIVFVYGHFLLGESINSYQIVGVLLLTIGTFFLTK
ncbi:MAG: EamA family transporter, partial [SAR324 cluster bacterium]|nr:EamA family transporter [SAR324 cluster bacterium]